MNLRVPPLLSLVAVNLIPLAGVLFWGWELFPLLLFFWMENVAIGIFAVVKMHRLAGITSVPLILFFLFHYGFFTLGHLIFVLFMFGPGEVGDVEIALGFVAMLLSHYNSYRLNFLGRKEYESTNAGREMFMPYGRIMLLQAVILIGGYQLQERGDALAPLLLLVGLKTLLDVVAHFLEHKVKTPGSPRNPVGINQNSINAHT